MKYQLTTQEFISYSGIPKRTLRRKIQEKEIVPVKSSKGLRFHYSQLPKGEIQGKYLSDHRLLTAGKSDAEKQNIKPWEREIADKRAAVVKEYLAAVKDVPTKKLTIFKNTFANHNKIASRTLDSHVKAYQSGGYHALVPNWHNGGHENVITKEMVKFIDDTYLVPCGPSIIMVYEQLSEKFCTKSTPLPSYRTVVNYINKKWTKAQQLLIRNKEAWDRLYSPFVRRDWDACELNEVWIADSKQIDNACIYRKKVIFPWLVVIMEAKSRTEWWILVPTANSLAIGQVICYAVSQVGPPKTFYCDRGKDYKSAHVSGKKARNVQGNSIKDGEEEAPIMGILGELGCETFFAAPYNAREKIIEANFGIFTDRLTELPGYRGHSVKTRPKKLAQEIKSGKLLTFEELSSKIDQLLTERNARPHTTTGKAPDSYWDGYQAVLPSQQFLDFLLMDVHVCPVKDSSVTVEGLPYRHDELFKLAGEKVEVRRDPKDIRRAAIIYQNKVFCSATLEMADHYRSEITLENVKTCARIRKKIKGFRNYILQHDDVIEDPLRVAVDLEQEQKTRSRDIRPAQSKVQRLHRKEKLARAVSRSMQEEDIKERQEAKVAAAGGSGFAERYLAALPPCPKQKPINFERLLGAPLSYRPNFQEYD